VTVHGLSEEADRASFKIIGFGMFGGLSSDNHYWHSTVAAPDVLEKAETTHLSHLDVGDDTHAP
jgi:hypothetical protein